MQDFFFIKVQREHIRINFSDILYIESLRNYTKLVTAARTYCVHTALKEWEELLPPEQFTRVHRSFIIAIGRIDVFTQDTISIAQHVLPLSKDRRTLLLANMKVLQPSQFQHYLLN